MIDRVNAAVYKIHKDAKIPFQATEMSACFDISACLHTEMVFAHGRNVGVPVENYGEKNPYVQIMPGEMLKIPTGLIFVLPPTHHMKVYPRSGNVWKRRLVVSNSPGVIDADYTLETFVLLENNTNDPQIIKQGMGIAQGEIMRNNTVSFAEIENKERMDEIINAIKATSSRRGGFGSTD